MATNGASNVEDTETSECDGEKVVTMMDVLQEQQEFEEDANAVLGASDDKNCTYSKGYIKRQALYACLTCCAEARYDDSKRAGVCLACSLNCHESHELLELYTKRNFRCDCGNPKFNSHPCTFTPNKTDLNLENNYNQNFSGIYCTCHRPYPDPEAIEEEEMIQCIVCEDWLHATHLDATVPPNDQYAEMICKACMEKNEFLHDYSNFAVNIEMGDIDIVSVNGNDSLLNSTTENTLTNGDVTHNPDEKEAMEINEIESGDKVLKNTETENEQTVDSNPQQTVKENIENDKLENPSEEVAHPDSEPGSNAAQIEESTSKTSIETEDTSKITENVEERNEKNTAAEIDSNKIVENNVSIQNETENEVNVSDEIPSEETKPPSDETKAPSEETKPPCEETKPLIEEINPTNEETKPTNEETKLTEDKTEVAEIGCLDQIEQQLTEMHKESEAQINNIHDDTQSKEHSASMDTAEPKTVENSEPNDAKSEIPVASENTDNASEVEQTESKLEADPADINLGTNQSIRMENKSDETTSSDGKDDLNTTNTDNHEDISDNPNKDEPNDASTTDKRKLEEDSDDPVTKKPKLDSQCSRPRNVKKIHKGATFWPSFFRQKLCTCNECLTMYKDLSVLFLIDPEDTVSAYETLGKEKSDGEPSTQYEKGMKALSSLDRIQQINALTEYNKMRDKLLDFLKSFKDKKEVVKEEDIRAFFADMKPKREPDGVYFCR